jgi:hypothetical protein
MLVFALFILTTLTPSITYASNTDRGVAESTRPFWTEHSSFAFSDTLYAVGVASDAPSSETGRQAAFMNGLEEIRNFGQMSNLDGLLIETQMTFEQPQSNGRVSVWRLLRVSLDGLRVLKATKTQAAVSQVRTTQEAPRVFSTEPSHTAAVEPPPVRSHTTAVITRQPVTTQEVNLPTVPLRYPQVITGWSQDAHGRIGVAWQDRQEWYVPVLKASDIAYARSVIGMTGSLLYPR